MLDTQSAIPSTRRGSGLYTNLALVVLSVVVGFAALEVLFRLTQGIEVLDIADWRRERVVVKRLGDRADPDPVLGWTLKPDYQGNGFNTIAHGIRRNGTETELRTGGVLVVGDSYTEGWSDVMDAETWPARLEARLGEPVLNAGVGGYASDQIILRAEQLLPVVRPRTLIVGFNEIDIFKSGHDIFGAPKPHFALQDGELRLHPPPSLEAAGRDGVLAEAHNGIRNALGYSAAIDRILGGLAPDYWYAGSRQDYRRVHHDEIKVTCALLERVKAVTDRSGIRLLLFLQHGGPLILEADKSSIHAQRVVACAEQAGIQVVDQFPSLRAIAVANRPALRAYYTMDGSAFGHMSAKGNAHAAELLAEALSAPAPGRRY